MLAGWMRMTGVTSRCHCWSAGR